MAPDVTSHNNSDVVMITSESPLGEVPIAISDANTNQADHASA